MLNLQNIFDTIDMIDKQHLDIRTITMGISLLDCVSEDPKRCCDKIYDKICRRAEKLVQTGRDIESEFGIPIVNKRISVTPMALVAGSCDTEDYVPFALTLDRAGKTCGVDFLGGYSALVQKGFSKGDELLLRSIPPGAGPDRSGMLQCQRGQHESRHQHGRGGPYGPHHQRDGPPVERQGRSGLRQAGGVLQRCGGQSLYGGRVPRRG